MVKGPTAAAWAAVVERAEAAIRRRDASEVKDRPCSIWLADLAPHLASLNVFRYITFRTGGATVTALFFVFFFGPRIISALRSEAGQGPADPRPTARSRHLLTKKGTPTMGGLMILLGLVVSTLLWANLRNPYVWVVLLVDRRLRRDRLLRRLSEGHQADAQRLFGQARLLIEAVIAVDRLLRS